MLCWCEYQMWFAYRADLDALHFASGFDMRVPAPRRAAIHPLLSLINERLWIGHFDLWTEEGQPTWRHTLLLRGTSGANNRVSLCSTVRPVSVMPSNSGRLNNRG